MDGVGIRHEEMEMRIPGHSRLATLMLAVLAAAPAARAAQAETGTNRIAAVEVLPAGSAAAKVVIRGSRQPTFTVFKLAEPARVVIDVAGADVTSVQSPIEVGKDGIAGITTAQFDEGARRVARVVVALVGDPRYDVVASGKDLVVTVGKAAAKAAASATETPNATATATKTATANPNATVTKTAAATPNAAVEDPNVVTTKTDSREVEDPATTLTAVSAQASGSAALVQIRTDAEVGTYSLIELRNPGRLALDLPGVTSAKKAFKAPGAGPVKAVRVARRDGGVRVVVDGAAGKMPAYQIERRPTGLEVRVGEQPVARKEAPAAPKKEVQAKVAAQPKLVPVRAVDLRADDRGSMVVVALESAVKYAVERPDATTAVLTLQGAALPARLERNLDASALGTQVTMLSSYRAPGTAGEVKVVAMLRAAGKDQLTLDKGRLTWRFPGTAALAQAATPRGRAAAAASEAKAAAARSVYDDKAYTGRRVDFNVKDMDIKNLLSAIAEISKRNIILADDVAGKVTIKLRNVPWDQALDIILRSKNLGREEVGNIIRVAPLGTLRAEAKEAAESQKLERSFEPLKVRLIPVNYAKAADMTDKLKDALTERGTVSTDTRTNTIIVKDVSESLARAEGIVRNLDTATPEVLIESRIVEAATSFTRQVGIQWGGNLSFAPTFGNPTGLIFPNILQAAGAADDPAAPVGGLTGVAQPNFAVNMPAPIGLNNGGGLGFVFGSAGGAANLHLRLSAAENSGTIKTISSPRVVTLDNVEASVGQGVQIPYSQISAAGVNTTFIEAKLELRVTPHVTQEGSIQMKIQATNNQPNPQLTGANGQPSITRREAKTEVLVKDGDTTVIGGIYTRRNAEAFNEVPVLSRIPILGWLFKKKAITDDRTELLIFITPRIVNRSQSTVAAAKGADESGEKQ